MRKGWACAALFACARGWCAMSWTGAEDGVSLFKEGNWLDDNGRVPASLTIEKGVRLTADTGGLIEILAGFGGPTNFNGDFKLAVGDDLRIANGYVLRGKDDIVGGGQNSELWLEGAGTRLEVVRLAGFGSIVVTNGARVEFEQDEGVHFAGASSVLRLVDSASLRARSFHSGGRVEVDGTSVLRLSAAEAPLGEVEVHLEPGARLAFATRAAFDEHARDLFVDGYSFADDPGVLLFSAETPAEATATPPNSDPLALSFSANPAERVGPGPVELSWRALRARRLDLAMSDSVFTSLVVDAEAEFLPREGALVVEGVSTSTVFRLTAWAAADGSGAADALETSVTFAPPDPASDHDRDGLPDRAEIEIHGTRYDLRDTDGDGTPDGLEVTRGTDPNDPSDFLERPNIVFFFCDDLGYGDLGCFWQDQRDGEPRFDTPHIDRLAAEGAMLTHHYVGAPVCAPSRSSLMQGRHQGHSDIRDNAFDEPLPDNHTLARLLRDAGYRTIHLGKSGLAGKETEVVGDSAEALPGHPLKRGFDEFFGYLFHNDAHEHYPRNGTSDKVAHIFNGYQRIRNASLDLYTTDAWTAYAKKAILEEHQDGDQQPFFLYVAYDAPHQKTQRPAVPYPSGGGVDGGVSWTTETDAFGRVRYASTATGEGVVDGFDHPDNAPSWPLEHKQHVGMIRRIGESVNDIVDLLDDLGLRENTLIVFSSDNGPHNARHDPRYFGSFAGFEGIKRDLLEGGVRVPTIVNWPDRIHGATGDENAIARIERSSAMWDWMPTFAEIAGVPAPAWCDGVSLLPALFGRPNPRERDYLYFEYDPPGSHDTPNWPAYFPNHAGASSDHGQAVRVGDYMGLREKGAGAFSVYDVVRDPAQATNLVAVMPELEQEMRAIAARARRPNAGAPRPFDAAVMPNAARSVVAGLDYTAHEGFWSYIPEFRDMKPVARGSVAHPSSSARSREHHVGILFHGYIEAPLAGEYTFHLRSDSGAHLFIHDAHVIDDDFNHDGSEKPGAVVLEAGPHPIRVYYRNGGAETYDLRLSWSGPGIAKQRVPDSAFYRLPELRTTFAERADDLLTISWNSTTGRTYRVRFAEDLNQPRAAWADLMRAIPSNPPTNSIAVRRSTDHGFYLVEEETE